MVGTTLFEKENKGFPLEPPTKETLESIHDWGTKKECLTEKGM
jgi:hypothetical protein